MLRLTQLLCQQLLPSAVLKMVKIEFLLPSKGSKGQLPFISLSDPDETELSCVLTKTGCSASVIICSNSFFLSFYQILYNIEDVFGQACSESLGDFIDQYAKSFRLCSLRTPNLIR